MEMSLMEMWTKSGYTAKGVIIILLICSVYSITVMIEKYRTYRAARKESIEFLPVLSKFVAANLFYILLAPVVLRCHVKTTRRFGHLADQLQP